MPLVCFYRGECRSLYFVDIIILLHKLLILLFKAKTDEGKFKLDDFKKAFGLEILGVSSLTFMI